jgi:hypothetical protein
MKYFTVALLNRFRSEDEGVSARAHRDWEAALTHYRQREKQIKATLPEGVRRFVDAHVCLHDALLLNMGRQGDIFVIVLEMEPPSQNLVILTFTLDGEPRIANTALKGKTAGETVTWMYEEWNVDRRRRGCFAVLLSNGWTVELTFRDFAYLIVKQVVPSGKGQANLSSTTVPRSA